MRIKLLLMFKNEGRLLKSWIKYHARLVGRDNLVIFDNGSTCGETIEAIDWAKSNSVTIDGSLSTRDDFVTRGDLFRDIINEKTYKFRADYYIPLDCDEFLAVERNERLSISPSVLKSELRQYRGATRALAIHAGLDNVPGRPGQFTWAPDHFKRFFTAGNCFWLDHGYHCGLGMNGDEPIKTRIVYIHYHYKPYKMLLEHSREKLLPYISDFSKERLLDYIEKKQPAYHCAFHLLWSEADYLDQFASASPIHFPEIEGAFRRIGEPLPFDDRPETGTPRSADGLWRSLKARFGQAL